jgi:hypothetical protein
VHAAAPPRGVPARLDLDLDAEVDPVGADADVPGDPARAAVRADDERRVDVAVRGCAAGRPSASSSIPGTATPVRATAPASRAAPAAPSSNSARFTIASTRLGPLRDPRDARSRLNVAASMRSRTGGSRSAGRAASVAPTRPPPQVL